MVGLSERTADAIRTLDEHWDGRGQPRGLRGERSRCSAASCASPRPSRSSTRRAGSRAPTASQAPRRPLVRPRRSWTCSARSATTTASGPRSASRTWPAGSRPTRCWSPTRTPARPLADRVRRVIDAKSPWTYRHSDRTSLIATNMGAALGFDHEGLGRLRRVGLLHDIGKLALSNRILDKPGSLTDAEFERVKEHPLFTQWVLERVSCFARHRADRGRAPRAARRRRIPARPDGRRAHVADARPRGGRRLRGAHR